ncbi:potassium channel family protein [Halarcobacter anaerophilus]|uniref:Potassium transporter TrkA n=1 Tax=Halarcobacter anaerophilus TaxID=877500 RepID=A0A4Q0Y5B0_9BACT|nr:NAD-binding protein [Halarcobacter anaerophilus]QDF29611.1 TrkA domain-containing protein [Halarcobacter anaerophilus]RXJ64845.1 potassium transporter TrkA [Halarcobacter anaerophilus]
MKDSSLFIVLQRMRGPFLIIVITYTIAIVGLLVITGVDDKGQPYQMTIFDAFYFVTYTATTIGFGETPYTFTYPQRLWVSFSIYLTVLGWFYGIGSVVSLLGDKVFLREIKRAKFKRQVKTLKQKFIIILGYNKISSEIIHRALEQNIRTVVIEKNESRANDLILENFTPTVPVLVADAYTPKVLMEAGIKKYNCKGLVSIFEDDSLNLRIALTSKLLNSHIRLAVKSTTLNHSENLRDLNVEIIANPFSIISSEIAMALNAPNLLKLEKWIYKIDDLNANLPIFPKGKYIVCGYGRMGQHIYENLREDKVEAEFVELDRLKVENFIPNESLHITYGNADDKEMLSNVGIQDAVAIISATNDDTTNLSILATAKKLNPRIMTIARENEMEDFSIFKNAKIDHIFMPSRILINKTTNALISPLSDKFITLMCKEDDIWGAKLVRDLVQTIDENPKLYELKVDKYQAPQIIDTIKEGKEVLLKIFSRSLYNREQKNNIIPLLLIREEEEKILPAYETPLKEGDEILFACDENAKDDIEYIAQNLYEFYYAYTGEEKRTIFVRNKK